jgi:hypothetical protein
LEPSVVVDLESSDPLVVWVVATSELAPESSTFVVVDDGFLSMMSFDPASPPPIPTSRVFSSLVSVISAAATFTPDDGITGWGEV